MDFVKKFSSAIVALAFTLAAGLAFGQAKPYIPPSTIMGNAAVSQAPAVPLTPAQINSMINNALGSMPQGLTYAQLNEQYTSANVKGNVIYPTLDAGLAQWNGSAWIQGVRYQLFQSGVDAIFAPAGTMGNNCAFTLGTALDATYPHAFIYLPAAAIVTGSQPGWYYAVMTDTTHGTCYNNVYQFGQPTIPSSPIGWSTTGPGAWTPAINAGINAYTANIPANSLGVNGAISIRVSWSANNNSNQKGVGFIYGGQSIGSLTDYQTTGVNFNTTRMMVNRGVTNAQVINGTQGTGTFLAQSFNTVNSGLTFPLNITFNRITSAADYIVLHYATIDEIPSGALDAPGVTTQSPASATLVPPCAQALGFTHNFWFLKPTTADISFATNTTFKMYASPGSSTANFTTTGDGLLSMNQLGGGSLGLDSVNNSGVAGLLPTLLSSNSWYFEAGLRITNNSPDHWQAVYSNPTEKVGHGTQPYVEVDGDEQIGGLSVNNPFYGSTNSALNWASGSSGAATTYNNLGVSVTGPNIDRTVEHIYGYYYNASNGEIGYCLDGVKQPLTVNTVSLGFNANINPLHYYLILNADSHGANVPYSLIVRYIAAWTP